MVTKHSLLDHTHIEVRKKYSKGRAHCNTIDVGELITFMGDEGGAHGAEFEESLEGVLRYGEGGRSVIMEESGADHVDGFLHRYIRKETLNIEGGDGACQRRVSNEAEELSGGLHSIFAGYVGRDQGVELLRQSISGGWDLADYGAKWVAIFMGFHIHIYIYIAGFIVALDPQQTYGRGKGIDLVDDLVGLSFDVVDGVFPSYFKFCVIVEDDIEFIMVFLSVNED